MIKDAIVLDKSEQGSHPIVIPSANNEDFITGSVFEISDKEMLSQMFIK